MHFESFDVAGPIALRMGFIDKTELEHVAARLGKSDYAAYIQRALMEDRV